MINYECPICPRNCKINRNENNNGYCRTDNDYYISSIVIHKGEEPPISGTKGICNVFFAHCNLQCVYCQNHQISNNKSDLQKHRTTLEKSVNQIIEILKTGVEAVGFVSPSHFVEQTINIIEELHKQKYYPTIVYNSNGYDNTESLKRLENYVDVYIPDLKYSDSGIAKKYSGAANYPQIAQEAIKEMYRQKGDTLFINKNGYAESGIIIRHLVLPNNTKNSINVLNFIAKEISTDIHISLMSQYYPTYNSSKYPEISRALTKQEYDEVVEETQKLGLNNGWIQELSSNDFYRPDFEKENPFSN